MCPRSSDPFYIEFLLYEMGHHFWTYCIYILADNLFFHEWQERYFLLENVIYKITDFSEFIYK